VGAVGRRTPAPMTILPESATWAGTTGELLLIERFIVAVLVDGGNQPSGNAGDILPPPTVHGSNCTWAIAPGSSRNDWRTLHRAGGRREAVGHRSPVDWTYLQGRSTSVKQI